MPGGDKVQKKESAAGAAGTAFPARGWVTRNEDKSNDNCPYVLHFFGHRLRKTGFTPFITSFCEAKLTVFAAFTA